MKLREYQNQAIQELSDCFKNGKRRVVFCLPTGGGKTICFSEIARRVVSKNINNKVLILTDRIELLSQAGGSLMRAGLDIGLIMAGGTSMIPRNQVIVGMVETYARRVTKGWKINGLALIVIDEAHKGNFKKIINHHKDDDVFIIGATATPISSSKKDSLKNYYEDIIVGTDIPELIGLEFLANPKYYAVKAEITAKAGSNGDYKERDLFNDFNKKVLYDGCVENYRIHALGKKTLIFCVNIEHAKNTAQSFVDAGFLSTRYIVSEGITPLERKKMLKWYSETPNAILVNCGILTTGFDEPSIECVMLNRATKSLPLYLQMVGRGARVTEDKSRFIVIDMGNNIGTHGFWDDYRDWRQIFFDTTPPKDKTTEAKTKECPECKSILHLSKPLCPECGYKFPKEEKEGVFALTEEINPQEYRHLYKKKPTEMTVEELIIRTQLGNERTGSPYKKGWTLYQLKERENPEEALLEYAQLMGYKPGWVKYQMKQLESV